jgi:hydrogenase nickel incorporation protein HypA/HybF
MHEFSLAQNIIEIAEETVKKNKLKQVTVLLLEIGTLSGVELPALDMALESLTPGSILDGTEIKKEIVQAVAICNHCGNEYTPEDYLSLCPKCGSYGSEVVKGKELRVKSIIAE